MQLTGSPEAIEQLKLLTKENKEYLKFLLSEAKTNSSASTVYKGKDGKKYTLKVNTVTSVIDVQPTEE